TTKIASVCFCTAAPSGVRIAGLAAASASSSGTAARQTSSAAAPALGDGASSSSTRRARLRRSAASAAAASGTATANATSAPDGVRNVNAAITSVVALRRGERRDALSAPDRVALLALGAVPRELRAQEVGLLLAQDQLEVRLRALVAPVRPHRVLER